MPPLRAPRSPDVDADRTARGYMRNCSSASRVYLPVSQPNHYEYPRGLVGGSPARRAIFVASRRPLDNALLAIGAPRAPASSLKGLFVMRVILGQVHRSKICRSFPRRPSARMGGRRQHGLVRRSLAAGRDADQHRAQSDVVRSSRRKSGRQRPSGCCYVRPNGRSAGRIRGTRKTRPPSCRYIHAVAGERFDVIFVDGMARAACLVAARAAQAWRSGISAR